MHNRPTRPISSAGLAVGLFLFLLMIYVGSFGYLSSYGNPEPSPFSASGYYFADPMTNEGSDRHELLCRVYFPLIEVDYRLVSGRRPGETLNQMLSCVDEEDWFVTP